MPAENQKVFSVSELTKHVKNTIEDTFGSLWVEGEVSGTRVYGSGHTYFTLKDAGAQISAVLFAGSARAAGGVTLKDGLQVRVYGQLTVYEQRGAYQLVVRKIQLGGVGALMQRFEELKRRLAAEGLFDQSRKRPLPFLPRRIGVVTSPDGAAIRDVLSVVGRRFPNLHIVIAPTRVQGAGAEKEIAAAIDLLNEYGGPRRPADSPCPRLDVIIVTRGGGSLEDLWCFNEEEVARAIVRSELPVISAVGHEIDTSLSDYAADLRAATPSAAAELVVGRKDDFEATLSEAEGRITRAMLNRVTVLRGRLDAARVNRVFSEPGHAVERLAQHVDMLDSRLRSSLANRFAALRRRFDAASTRLISQQAAQVPAIRARITDLDGRMKRAAQAGKEKAARRLDSAAARIDALNPLGVLKRGYSLTRLDDGTLLTDPSQAAPDSRLVTRLATGEVRSTVDGAVSKDSATVRKPSRKKVVNAEPSLFLPGFE